MCIRDRYQRRVRGTPKHAMVTLAETTVLVGMLAAVAVLVVSYVQRWGQRRDFCKPPREECLRTLEREYTHAHWGCLIVGTLASTGTMGVAVVTFAKSMWPLMIAVALAGLLCEHYVRQKTASLNAKGGAPKPSECARLLQAMLEHGDGVAQDSVDLINEVIWVLVGEQPLQSVCDPLSDECEASTRGLGCHAGSAKGSGTGFGGAVGENLPIKHDAPRSVPIQQASMMERLPGAPAQHDNTQPPAPRGRPQDPLALLSGVASEEMNNNPAPCVDWPRHPMGSLSPRLQERPSMFCARPEPLMGRNGCLLMFSTELLAMTFDAMAQVELSTGAVTWLNQGFQDLTLMIGRGDPGLGLQQLHDRFLRQCSREFARSHASMSVGGNMLDLWSATQVLGTPGRELVLWVIRVPLSFQSAPAPHPPTPTLVRSPSSSMRGGNPNGESFPKASEYTNPQSKVVCGPVNTKGRRSVLLLWHKYGKKSVYIPSPDGLSEPE
eukprot:TRINITY_DN346_c0_g1_i3.p1 TRINITY_DN346_c0_g1~~TRINITY_DN346_c0_g1_i3.p1  ORF type:complete len:494 (+),score=91.08 TRINITY_DN346_c0_g1_i3:116-1597(+)